MPKTTAQRLKAIMEQNNLKQVDILHAAKPYCEKYNVTLGKSDLSQFVNGKVTPGQQKLTILGLALNVSEAWLMGLDVPMQRGLTLCPVCGLLYASDLELDTIEHNQYHEKYVAARNHFGICHLPSESERIKGEVCPLLLNQSKGTIEERCASTIRLFETYFSNSVIANDFNLSHPSFDEYISMLLNQNHWESYPDKEVYTNLVYKYGKKPGLGEGKTVYKISATDRKNASIGSDEEELIKDYLELSNQGKEYIRQTMYMAKQTYKKMDSAPHMEKIS